MKILVVDDNEGAAESISLLLGDLGHEVRTAYSGVEAFAVADRFLPKLVLCDVDMPGMDGYEVASQLRCVRGLKDTVLIAVTGWGDYLDQVRCKEAGFARLLNKPVDWETLKEAVAEQE